MPTVSTTLRERLRGNVMTLAVCWRVTRRDGVTLLGTEHDRDLTITDNSTSINLLGTYRAAAGITGSDVKSSSDMSVDNMEVQGAIAPNGDLSIVDLSAADIEAGLFDDASVVLFIVDWSDLSAGQIIIRTGNIGEITRDSNGAYKTELRGLAQRLTQNICRTYSASCDAELGDARCKVDITAYTVEGEVTAVTSAREFDALLAASSPEAPNDLYDGGMVTWLTGDNATYSMEVKRRIEGSPESNVLLFLPMPTDIQVGDTFTIRPGCNKTPAMCKSRFNNLINYRGHGSWVPGIGEILAFGGQTAAKKPKDPDWLVWPKP